MRTLSWLSTIAALVVAGCGNPYGYYNGSPYVGGPIPTSFNTSTISAGLPTTVSPGVQAGYGISANTCVGNPVGCGSFRVVWTGDALASTTFREFYGSIWTTGHFLPDQLVPGCANQLCALEPGDAISNPKSLPDGSQRIDFDTFATDGLDGLDFVVDAEPVVFDFYIDGYPIVAQEVLFPSPASTRADHIATVAGTPFGMMVQ
jgi:hypothetical protein